jgi:hypothetical protein
LEIINGINYDIIHGLCLLVVMSELSQNQLEERLYMDYKNIIDIMMDEIITFSTRHIILVTN